jgi:hypothetical protein
MFVAVLLRWTVVAQAPPSGLKIEESSAACASSLQGDFQPTIVTPSNTQVGVEAREGIAQDNTGVQFEVTNLNTETVHLNGQPFTNEDAHNIFKMVHQMKVDKTEQFKAGEDGVVFFPPMYKGKRYVVKTAAPGKQRENRFLQDEGLRIWRLHQQECGTSVATFCAAGLAVVEFDANEEFVIMEALQSGSLLDWLRSSPENGSKSRRLKMLVKIKRRMASCFWESPVEKACHGDFHWNNVMFRECNQRLTNEEEKEEDCIPEPVFIDVPVQKTSLKSRLAIAMERLLVTVMLYVPTQALPEVDLETGRFKLLTTANAGSEVGAILKATIARAVELMTVAEAELVVATAEVLMRTWKFEVEIAKQRGSESEPQTEEAQIQMEHAIMGEIESLEKAMEQELGRSEVAKNLI